MSLELFIDPPSPHFLGDRLFATDHATGIGDALNAPYIAVRDRLAALGVPVHTADALPDQPAADGTTRVYVSMGLLARYPALLLRPDVLLSAFFALECPIVEPSLYRALGPVQRAFRHVYSWSDSASLVRFVGEPLKCEPFRWPQPYGDVHQSVWTNTERRFLVMINSNKLPRLYWQELYTERLRAVEYFSRTDEIDLYGPGWGGPSNRTGRTWEPWTLRRWRHALTTRWQQFRPDPRLVAARRVWRGTAASKSQALGSYTFALCFENMVLRGWITEKIFDCFFAGTVPVYWGAPEIAEVIPPACFIDMREFGRDYAALARFLRSLTPQDVERYREAARSFIQSPAFQPFSTAAFVQRFVGLVDEAAAQRGVTFAPAAVEAAPAHA